MPGFSDTTFTDPARIRNLCIIAQSELQTAR